MFDICMIVLLSILTIIMIFVAVLYAIEIFRNDKKNKTDDKKIDKKPEVKKTHFTHKKKHQLSDTSIRLIDKADKTGELNAVQYASVITNMFISEDEYIMDTGTPNNVYAEIILRLRGKEKELHDIFWRK